MTYKSYADSLAFYNDVFDIVAEKEVENNIPLRNIVRIKKGEYTDWHLSTISDGGGILLAAVMTPPHNMTICRTDHCGDVVFDEALECLADNLIKDNVSVPGVMSPNETAERFAGIYAAKTDRTYETRKNLRAYNLFSVSGDIKRVGTLRLMNEKDLSYLPYWIAAFNGDTHNAPGTLCEACMNAKSRIGDSRLYVLEDNGCPVTMASMTVETFKSRAIGSVYTPPYFRNNGYATSCVAGVSQKILDMGYEYAVLFTDLSNPTSNDIYQKIGYKPVCDMKEIAFK